MMKPNYTCDVLIIGGGSAGLRAAIEAHDAGANVLVISTSKKGDPHTTLARAAAIFKTESIRQNILFFSTG